MHSWPVSFVHYNFFHSQILFIFFFFIDIMISHCEEVSVTSATDAVGSSKDPLAVQHGPSAVRCIFSIGIAVVPYSHNKGILELWFHLHPINYSSFISLIYSLGWGGIISKQSKLIFLGHDKYPRVTTVKDTAGHHITPHEITFLSFAWFKYGLRLYFEMQGAILWTKLKSKQSHWLEMAFFRNSEWN